jgi:hypothetical protein
MGLHRDGSQYGMSPVETHVRRLVWFQLCFLDIRTCEASGPRPQIRSREEGGFDTKFPLNVDDEDLLQPNPPTEDSKHWTSMTLFLIRIRANEVQRMIWEERPKVEKNTTTITAVLGKLQRARADLHNRFLPMLDDSVPIQLLCRHVWHVVIDRWHISFLHRYHNSVAQRMPDRLRQLILTSGTSQMEHAIAVDTQPSLAPWQWYSGALQQYHIAVLMLFEIYAYPMRKEADRIWACLDYVFDIPAGLNRDQKAKLVLGELAHRVKVYHSLRKTKAPVTMEKMPGFKAPKTAGNEGQQPSMLALPGGIPTSEGSSSGVALAPINISGVSPPPNMNATSMPPSSTAMGLDYDFNQAPGVSVMSGTMGQANAGMVEQMYPPGSNAGQWSPQPSSDSGSVRFEGIPGAGAPTNANDLQAVMDIDWVSVVSLHHLVQTR